MFTNLKKVFKRNLNNDDMEPVETPDRTEHVDLDNEIHLDCFANDANEVVLVYFRFPKGRQPKRGRIEPPVGFVSYVGVDGVFPDEPVPGDILLEKYSENGTKRVDAICYNPSKLFELATPVTVRLKDHMTIAGTIRINATVSASASVLASLLNGSGVQEKVSDKLIEKYITSPQLLKNIYQEMQDKSRYYLDRDAIYDSLQEIETQLRDRLKDEPVFSLQGVVPQSISFRVDLMQLIALKDLALQQRLIATEQQIELQRMIDEAKDAQRKKELAAKLDAIKGQSSTPENPEQI